MLIQCSKAERPRPEINLICAPGQVPHLEVAVGKAMVQHGLEVVVMLQALGKGVSDKDDIAVLVGIKFSDRLTIIAGHCQQSNRCAEKQDDVPRNSFVGTVTYHYIVGFTSLDFDLNWGFSPSLFEE